jgi:hypothetical protein
MAKLKKAPGRLIGRWKQEAIAANAGASDEALAKIINETAKAQGYRYTITPEKVREKSKKKRKRKKRAAEPAQADASAAATTKPTAKPAAKAGISLEDVRALKGLVDRVGADAVRELAVVLG